MPARPICRIFIPMMRHGQLLCARCGVHIDIHPAEVNRQQPNGGGQANRMLHLDRHAVRMGIRLNRQPPPPPPLPNPGMDHMNNNNNNNNYNILNNNNHWPNHQLPAEEEDDDGYVVDGEDDDVGVSELNSNTFTIEQLRRMLAMARSLGWSLRGRSRDANLNQFCQEIGITRLQFSNWLSRNRARFARRHRR